MKKATLVILLFLTSYAAAGAKEDMQNMRNKISLELTEARLELIDKDPDLKILFSNIIRTHGRLAAILEKHPDLADKNLKEPKRSQLKVKLLSEDEDLRDIRMSLIRMHRKLEESLLKNSRIKELTQRLNSLDTRLSKLK